MKAKNTIITDAAAMIISNHPQAICEALSQEFGSGITILSARGCYSDSEKQMIYFVVNRFRISKVREIVRANDPLAFVTITEIADVMGDSMSNETSAKP